MQHAFSGSQHKVSPPRRRSRTAVIATAALAFFLLMAQPLSAQPASERGTAESPWWQRQKIVFMWGQWNYVRTDKSVDYWIGELPREHFRNVALAGGTVFTEATGMVKGYAYWPSHAHHAHEFGLKYFVTRYVGLPRYRVSTDDSGRPWVNERGESPGGRYNCTLEHARYDDWIVKPLLEGVEKGLIDGIFVDWENYGGNHEAGMCYCEECFSRFVRSRDLAVDLPDKAERFPWLKEHGLDDAYKRSFHQQRFEMFAAIRERLHAANPDLLFASYDVLRPSSDGGHGLYAPAWDYIRAMQTERTPHLVLDPRHYGTDDRQPWWQSYSAHLRKAGCLYIPGGWTNALFGAQASQVSAARWIYEASINEDGCWLWFERELDDEILRAYSTADRQLKIVQHKLGRYLFEGERDPHFVTPVEWTGRPELAEAVFTRTYHLDNEHLVHVSNLDTAWPLRVRLRVPPQRVASQSVTSWTVRDALGDVYYAWDGVSSEWTPDRLSDGITVTLDPRSDLFLLLAPAAEDSNIPLSQLIHSRDFGVLPGHDPAEHKTSVSGAKSKDEEPSDALPPGVPRILYTATTPMGFLGNEGGLTIGNGIHLVGVDGQEGRAGRRLRHLRGHLWSTSYSPDGQRIVFVHDAGGRGQIFTMDAIGSNVLNLSRNEFCDRAPVWSPAGEKLAFLSDREGDWDVFVMNADGSNQRRVAGNRGNDRAPVWSPDGKRLAWESDVAGMPTIWVCESDGSASRPLIDPQKSLKHTWTEKWATDSPVSLRTIEKTYPDEVHHLKRPTWSPDGKRIAAVRDGFGGYLGSLVVIEADGSWMMRVNAEHVACSGNLTWSPDGTRLAGTYRCPTESERAGVFVLHGDRAAERRNVVEAVPQGPRLGGARRHGLMTWYSHGSAALPRVVKTFTSLKWSPNGETLAFSSDLDPSGAFYVYTVDVSSSSLRRLEATKSAWPNDVAWGTR